MLTLAAPAKLNLYLHLTGRRTDGYHLLESLVTFTTLHDTLDMAAHDILAFSVVGEFAAQAGVENNLVLRAAQLLQRETGTAHGACLRLTKAIPVGAGLGGGSADAAAALRGLNNLWQLGLADEQLKEIAAKLGADVPMCLVGQPLIARGIGDEITRCRTALPAMHAVLAHPRIPLLTKHVYAMVDKKNDHHNEMDMPRFTRDDDFFSWLGQRCNDLQRPAITVSPVVAETLLVMETLLPKPELVRMTGSGACCFALFTDADRATRYAEAIRAYQPTWWVWVTGIKGK